MRLTDEDAMKILERCINDDHCGDCPLEYLSDECMEYRSNLLNVTFGVINRQKAEIERLRNTVVDLNANLSETVNCFTRMETLYKIKCKELEVAKAEAIKEFAERLKEKTDINEYLINILENAEYEIDNLVKEMVGE